MLAEVALFCSGTREACFPVIGFPIDVMISRLVVAVAAAVAAALTLTLSVNYILSLPTCCLSDHDESDCDWDCLLRLCFSLSLLLLLLGVSPLFSLTRDTSFISAALDAFCNAVSVVVCFVLVSFGANTQACESEDGVRGA